METETIWFTVPYGKDELKKLPTPKEKEIYNTTPLNWNMITDYARVSKISNIVNHIQCQPHKMPTCRVRTALKKNTGRTNRFLTEYFRWCSKKSTSTFLLGFSNLTWRRSYDTYMYRQKWRQMCPQTHGRFK